MHLRRDGAQQRRARAHPRHPLRRRNSLERIHDRHRRRHSRQKRNRADRARSALPRRRIHQPSRRTHRPARASGQIFARGGAPRGADRRRAAARDFHDRGFAREARDHLGEDNVSSPTTWKKATWMPRGRSADIIVEGEYRTGRAGAALHRKSGHDRDGKSRGRRDRLGIAAVSLLRAQGAGHVV